MQINDEKKAIILEKVQGSIDKFGQGIELVEIKYTKEYGKVNISLLIWKEEGISLDDCEAVHNYISPLFDELDSLFEEDYILNVSSQGLDRPIITSDDFRRAMNTDVEIISKDKTKKHGKLVSYSEEEIVILNDKNKEIKTNRNNIAKVQPYISF